jgi:hypothetical protein
MPGWTHFATIKCQVGGRPDNDYATAGHFSPALRTKKRRTRPFVMPVNQMSFGRSGGGLRSSLFRFPHTALQSATGANRESMKVVLMKLYHLDNSDLAVQNLRRFCGGESYAQ